MLYNTHTELFYYRKCLLQSIQIRRLQNAIARSSGFRNFREMTGE